MKILRSTLALAFLVSSIGLQAQDEDVPELSATIKSLNAWLEKPHNERANLPTQKFSTEGLSKADAATAQKLLWADYAQMIKETRGDEVDGKRLDVGDKVMPYLLKTFGDKPKGGRSLYISMHGGGGAPKRVNDSQWKNQIHLYQPKEGIYLAPRAPTDTWNLWHQGHIDALFDRLITNLVVFEDVNPDKVYLMGYSAGGDGVYQLAPRMADRFAAAAMMAGHPNETVPLGLRNLPFTLHVGGLDKAYKRNEIVPQWDKKLTELHEADPGGYIHEAKVHEGKPHWMNLEDKVAVPWMAKFSRKRFPDRVVWKQDDVAHRRFYWLGVPEDSMKGRQLVIVKREGQTFTVEKAEDIARVTIFLNDEMVDMDKPVVVKMGGEVLYEGKVERSLRAIHGTMVGRGDPGIVFSGGLTVDLDTAEPTKESALMMLRELHTALKKNDVEKVKKIIRNPPPGLSDENWIEGLMSSIENKEISQEGIEILGKEGKWGRLTEVFPERGKKIAGQFKVEPDDCWGLYYHGGEAAFYWDGERFQVIRCDDIGKLD